MRAGLDFAHLEKIVHIIGLVNKPSEKRCCERTLMLLIKDYEGA